MASEIEETDEITVFAGDCTVRFEHDQSDDSDTPQGEIREERGSIVLIEKPDGTVLVHDQDGYRPVAWLTRADVVSWSPDGSAMRAVSGDQCLLLTCHEEHGYGQYPTTRAGTEAGACPDCGGTLLREPDAVVCLDCELEHSIPRDSTLLEEPCDICSLPQMRVERGDRFELCVNRSCESLDDAVRAVFDRTFGCPACEGDLLIRRRGGLILGCENYPECDTGFSLPTGQFEGICDCGLPLVKTEDTRRCLDASCSLLESASSGT